jgi:hypothetical protein
MLAVSHGSDGLLTTGPVPCLLADVAARSCTADTGPMGDDAPWTDPVVVPDDIRALQADIDAYHREVRQSRRPRWMQRLTTSPGWRDSAFPAGVLTGAFTLAAIVFIVLTVGGGTNAPRVTPEPVSTTATAPPGHLHGVIPDVSLTTAQGDVKSAQWMRPALVALVPHRCACASLIDELAGRAAEVNVSVFVVAPGAQDADVAALPGQTHNGRVVAMFDATGTLASTYRASGVTVLVLAPNATVTYIRRNVQPGNSYLELPLMSGMVTGPTSSVS